MPEEKLADMPVMLDLIGRYRKKVGQGLEIFFIEKIMQLLIKSNRDITRCQKLYQEVKRSNLMWYTSSKKSSR